MLSSPLVSAVFGADAERFLLYVRFCFGVDVGCESYDVDDDDDDGGDFAFGRLPRLLGGVCCDDRGADPDRCGVPVCSLLCCGSIRSAFDVHAYCQ